MQYRSIILFSIVPLAIIIMVALGLFAPRKSYEPNHPSPLSSPPRGEEVKKEFASPSRGEAPPKAGVRVGSASLNVEIASTPETRHKGLSGHAPLNDNEGMLFIFDAPAPQTFWMVDMLFPLDIVWIGIDKKVLGITRDAPAPTPGTASGKLPLYSSPSPAQYVLEVNAGWAVKHGVKVGDEVTW